MLRIQKKSALAFTVLINIINMRTYAQDAGTNHLTISVIIPCHWRHFQFIENLLNELCKQTVLPNEVVISLSEANKLDSQIVQNVENKSYPFSVKIIKHTEKKLAGANRNSACEHATGDIIITNDADDLPHIQRIEIIRYAFEHSDAKMILHKFANKNFDIYNPYNIPSIAWSLMTQRPAPWVRPTKPYSSADYPQDLHHGNIAIRSEYFQLLKWPEDIAVGEDSIFDQCFFDQLGHIYLINIVLIKYRNELSSFALK